MRRSLILGAHAALIAAALVACGSEDAATGDKPQVIEVTMTDSKYSPASFEVSAGESVTFRFQNEGELQHEALIGTAADQAAHATEMASGGGEGDDAPSDGMDDMGSGHGGDTPGEALTVEPGESAEIEHTFPKAGEYLIGCHEPGHYEAGMKATVTAS